MPSVSNELLWTHDGLVEESEYTTDRLSVSASQSKKGTFYIPDSRYNTYNLLIFNNIYSIGYELGGTLKNN